MFALTGYTESGFLEGFDSPRMWDAWDFAHG